MYLQTFNFSQHSIWRYNMEVKNMKGVAVNIKANTTVVSKAFCHTEFKSLTQLEDYIENTPLNELFRWASLPSSQENFNNWSGTKNFEEAIEILKNGYQVGIEKLMGNIKCETKQVNDMAGKIMYDIAGFQCSVPRYLQGIPTSMINKKIVPIKKKVITLNKCIDYTGGVSAKQILEYSTRTLQIIRKLEAQGYAVNLNIVDGYKCNGGYYEIIKIRVKSCNERINISKLAFPLLHPSMLRRLMFRYVEVSDTTQLRTSYDSIGACVDDSQYRNLFDKQGEIFLNREVSQYDIENITKQKIK